MKEATADGATGPGDKFEETNEAEKAKGGKGGKGGKKTPRSKAGKSNSKARPTVREDCVMALLIGGGRGGSRLTSCSCNLE